MHSDALHDTALDALEAADMALAHAPELAIDEVHMADQITPDWLSGVLGAGVAGARLVSAALLDGHDGMTDRRRWRLGWNRIGQDAGLPQSVFIKATPTGPYLRETLALLHMAENEVRFYTSLQPELPDIAPKGYFGHFFPGGRFILIVEDLEASGCTPYWLHSECSPHHAEAVVSALAALHARYWESSRLETDLAWVRPRLHKFGRSWHRGSFVSARAKYPDTEFGSEMPDEIRAILALWSEHCDRVYTYWDSLPQTVLHGDSHLGNTYSRPGGSAGLFDWQVVFRDHGLRDVAYFIGSALSNEDRRIYEAPLLDRYLSELARHGIELNPGKASRDYALYGLDRFDAHMKTHVFGGYGHNKDAMKRGRDSVFGALIDNNAYEMIQQVIRTGGLS